jgi:hypothetical protein
MLVLEAQGYRAAFRVFQYTIVAEAEVDPTEERLVLAARVVEVTEIAQVMEAMPPQIQEEEEVVEEEGLSIKAEVVEVQVLLFLDGTHHQ